MKNLLTNFDDKKKRLNTKNCNKEDLETHLDTFYLRLTDTQENIEGVQYLLNNVLF